MFSSYSSGSGMRHVRQECRKSFAQEKGLQTNALPLKILPCRLQGLSMKYAMLFVSNCYPLLINYYKFRIHPQILDPSPNVRHTFELKSLTIIRVQ